MSNIIKHIRIDKLFGTTNIDWELNPSVNVLVGQNGAGKSTILRLIYLSLMAESIGKDESFLQCKVLFEDGKKNIVVNFIPIAKKQLQKAQQKTLSNSVEQKKNSSDALDAAIVTTILGALFTGSIPKGLAAGSLVGLLMQSQSSSNQNVKLNQITETHKFVENRKYLIEKENHEVKVEYISTINMSANSINNLTTSSGQNTTLLDIEINNEIQRLLSFNNEKLIDNLLSALNSLFLETNKTVSFNKNKLIISLSDDRKIDFDKLSSGERQVIFIFLKVVNASVDGALILMDEPEISLHLSWQEKLLNEIRRVNDKSQIIIVTHSPAMLMNGWMDSFVDIKNIMTEVEEDTEDNSDSSLTDNSLNDSNA